MSVTNLLTATDEDIFSRTLLLLEAELRFDIPQVSTGDFESVLDVVGLPSPTASSIDEGSSPESPTNDSASDSQALLRVAMKSKRYRNRKREELESLRSTVKTLEVRLAALKALPSQDSQLLPDQLYRGWEARAMLESEKRQQAERKNDELRQVVDVHMQLAQKLNQVIKKVVLHVNTNALV